LVATGRDSEAEWWKAPGPELPARSSEVDAFVLDRCEQGRDKIRVIGTVERGDHTPLCEPIESSRPEVELPATSARIERSSSILPTQRELDLEPGCGANLEANDEADPSSADPPMMADDDIGLALPSSVSGSRPR
jgi:hypothetical protein